jgi:quercetin dioxygenase-like cupin family protein
MAVSARSVKKLSRSATLGVVDMRRGHATLAGSYVYVGERVVTGWHAHDLDQIEYALRGVAEVETATAHLVLPPQQAAWIPAGLEHQTTIDASVHSVSVFFAPGSCPSPATAAASSPCRRWCER